MCKKLKNVLCLIAFLAMTTMLHAQESGWTVDEHDYQYQMSVYAKLEINGTDVTADENYEVAAFVGDECRGIATRDSQGGYNWLWMFVRSNSASGEKITFKVYDKTTQQVKKIAETVEFASDGQIGTASSPTAFTQAKYTLGDVNDDGKITSTDVRFTIYKILKKDMSTSNYIEEAMDMDSDGKITSTDVALIINIILKKS